LGDCRQGVRGGKKHCFETIDLERDKKKVSGEKNAGKRFSPRK